MSQEKTEKPNNISPLSGINGAFILDDPLSLIVKQAHLIDRVIYFDNRLPSEVTRANYIETSAVFSEAKELALLSNEISKALLSEDSIKIKLEDPDIEVPFDFDIPSYEEFENDVEEIYNEMLECPDELFDFSRQRGSMYFQISSNSGPTIYAARDDASTANGTRKWLAKLFAALGLKDVWQAILEVLEENYDWLMETIFERIKNKNWRGLKRNLKSLLQIFQTRSFRKKLIQKVGASAAAKIVGKIGSKFVPFLGWAILIGEIIWAIAEEFI